MITPTARSTTLPRRMNFLKPSTGVPPGVQAVCRRTSCTTVRFLEQ
jgi:hypothetical protein